MNNITWSYSALKQYTNCPKQYHHLRVLKDYESSESQATIYGKEVHKALENYVRYGIPLAKNYERFEAVVDELIAIDGDKYCEYEMALTKEKTSCDFNNPDRWVRGIVDLLIVSGSDAYIVDYKTGSNKYPDPKQLKLMALMVFANFPEVQNIKGGLLFIMQNSFVGEEYNRTEIDKLWSYFTPDLQRLSISFTNNTWMANPTPLCGWCPVKKCEFHKERY